MTAYQEATDAGMVTPMKYLMLPCSGCPPAAKNLNLPDVALKRVSYWQNNARNGAIRRFVYDLKSKFDGQIMIMVSTLVHAIELHKMLPWFKVAYYGRNDTKALTGKLKNVDWQATQVLRLLADTGRLAAQAALNKKVNCWNT